MSFLMKIGAAALAAGFALSLAGGASAATTTCSISGANTRSYSLDFTAPLSASCYATGDGNINGNVKQDPILNAKKTGNNTIAAFGSTTLLTSLEMIGDLSVKNGVASTTSPVLSILSGVVTVSNVSGFTDLILGVKAGANESPSWAAFSISGPGAYMLSMSDTSLSHFILYGVPAAVPLPATGILLVGALGGLGLMKRRRKTA